MPIMSSIAGVSVRAFGFAWGALTSIFDNWVSGTPRSLGTSTSGTPWTVVQGTWAASGGGMATTSTAASSYPFATVPLHQNVQSSIQNAQPGSGLVFWETGAGDWWASIVNATSASVQTGSYCIANSCCTGSNTCSANSCCTGSPAQCQPNSCCGGTITYHGSPPVPTCTGGSYNACCTMSANTCVYNSCCTGSNTCVSNSCCSYGYTYTTYYYWGLAVIKSVASAISTVASVTLGAFTVAAAQIQSLSLTVISGNVAAQAYSDTALTNPFGSPLTATGTPGGTKVGIMVAPTDTSAATAGTPYTQGNAVGPFSAH